MTLTNAQELYDYIGEFLIKQGKPSKVSSTGVTKEICAYRGVNGTKCAVGCLIPDDLYDKEMEGYRVNSLLEKFDLPSFIADNSAFLVQAQIVHDRSSSWIAGRSSFLAAWVKFGTQLELNVDKFLRIIT